MSRTYTVSWAITVEAASPREAALQVAALMAGRDFTPGDDVFQVVDHLGGGPITIDLAAVD